MPRETRPRKLFSTRERTDPDEEEEDAQGGRHSGLEGAEKIFPVVIGEVQIKRLLGSEFAHFHELFMKGRAWGVFGFKLNRDLLAEAATVGNPA